MMISYNDTHSNVRYGTKSDSLYNKMLSALVENDSVVRRNVEKYEAFITSRYGNGELSSDEYLELTSILDMLATDEYISKYNRKVRTSSRKLPDKKVEQRVLKAHDMENRTVDPLGTR